MRVQHCRVCPQAKFQSGEERKTERTMAAGASAGVVAAAGPDRTQYDLVYLFSHPLVKEDVAGGGLTPLPLLNLKTELREIKSWLEGAVGEIKMCSQICSTSAFGKLLDTGFRMLHYSGHGEPSFLACEGEVRVMCGTGTCLLLPNAFPIYQIGVHGCACDLIRCVEPTWQNGKMHPVRNLQELIRVQGQKKVSLVFLSACHSSDLGALFSQVGVPHVVCVNVNEKIADQASMTFAKQFYRSYAPLFPRPCGALLAQSSTIVTFVCDCHVSGRLRLILHMRFYWPSVCFLAKVSRLRSRRPKSWSVWIRLVGQTRRPSTVYYQKAMSNMMWFCFRSAAYPQGSYNSHHSTLSIQRGCR